MNDDPICIKCGGTCENPIPECPDYGVNSLHFDICDACEAFHRKDERKKLLKRIRKEIISKKQYGSNVREELFHYTGLIAILEAIQREDE